MAILKNTIAILNGALVINITAGINEAAIPSDILRDISTETFLLIRKLLNHPPIKLPPPAHA